MAAALAAATVLGGVFLRPQDEPEVNLEGLGFVSHVYPATVERAREEPCPGTAPDDDILCRETVLRLHQGPDAGGVTTISMPVSSTTPVLRPGEEVVLSHDPDAEEAFRYQFADRQRRPVLWWLFGLFVLVVVVLGGIRGLAAIAGLAASVGILLMFILPAILDGRDPFFVAVVGASAIAFLSLYLAHGFTPMTTVALLGTLGSLALTAGLAEVFVRLAAITGLASEEAIVVQIGASRVDLAGLMLGGVVIGALGAIDDMTVTQASTVWELRAANPRMGHRDLLRGGLRVGRDHVASVVNTLLLAYVGASMPLLILFILSGQSLGTVANGETVATEIIRTLVGSIGLVASVPITTWIAARVVSAGADTGTTGERAASARARRR